MDSMLWECQRCGHTVPIGNKEVHDARCFARRPGRPRRTSSSHRSAQSPFDPDEEPASPNVFTPSSGDSPQQQQQPQRPTQQHEAPASAGVSAPSRSSWREVDLQAAGLATTATTRRRVEREREQMDGRRRQPLEVPGARATTGDQRELDRQGQGGLRRRLLERGHGQPRERAMPSSSSSSSSPSSSTPSAAEARARVGGSASGQEGETAQPTRDTGEREATWACTACTFLNDLGVRNCEMCGTRIPPRLRPPDMNYRDVLIDPDPYTGLRERPRTSRDYENEMEEARCMAEAAVAALAADDSSVSTRGGGRGGRAAARGNGDQGEDGLIDTEGLFSGAAAGSAVGAIGAGMLSAMQPGVRPLSFVNSMIHGALIGGFAGAALGGAGNSLGVGSGTSSSGGGTGGGAAISSEERARQRWRELALEDVDVTRGRRRRGENVRAVVPDLELLMMVQELDDMNYPIAAEEMRQEMRHGMFGGPLGLGRLRGHAPPAWVLQQVQNEANANEARPSSARAIAALPQETVTNDSLSRFKGDNKQCCICLEDFEVGEGVTRLSCLHLYHTVCISNWLKTSGTCPQCKHRVD